MLFTRNNGNFANRYCSIFILQKNEGRMVRTDKNDNSRNMKKVWVMMLATLMVSSTMMAGNVKKSTTLPIEGEVVKASHPMIQYVGRVSFAKGASC